MSSAEPAAPARADGTRPTAVPPGPQHWIVGPVRTPAAAAIALLGGLLTGIGTQVLQGQLPGSWHVLANSGVMWSLAAAAVGMLMPTNRAAVAGGAASMVVASVSYYWAVDWFEGTASSGRSSLIWAAVGIFAGGAFGLVGRTIRRDRDRRWLALAVVAGLLLGEAHHLVGVVERLRPAGLVQAGLGVALALACLRSSRRPLVVTALVAVGTIGYTVAVRLVEAAFTVPL